MENNYDNNRDDRDDRNKRDNNKKPKNTSLIVFVIIAAIVTFVAITLLNSLFQNATYKEITYNQFLEMIDEGKVESVSLENDRILIYPTDDATEESNLTGMEYTYYTGYVGDDSLVSSGFT